MQRNSLRLKTNNQSSETIESRQISRIIYLFCIKQREDEIIEETQSWFTIKTEKIEGNVFDIKVMLQSKFKKCYHKHIKKWF